MTLYTAIRRGATMLLPGNWELRRDDIARLQKRCPEVRVQVRDPDLDDIVPFDEASDEQAYVEAAMTRATACASEVMKIANDSSPNRSNYTSLERAVSEVIAFIVMNPVGRVLPKVPFQPDSYLADHMSNVFFLAMQIASKNRHFVVSERMRQTHARDLSYVLAHSLLPLGIATLYMDMGMLELGEYERTNAPLSDRDWKRIRGHVEHTATKLPPWIPPAARVVIRHHHENADASGYPDKLPLERQHVFCRIARVCDSYDAAITPRRFRQPKSAIRALWEMTYGPLRSQYDPTLVRALDEIVEPFPLGTQLRLDDGRVATVCGRSRDPFTPLAAITHDEAGRLRPTYEVRQAVLLTGEDGVPRIETCDGEDVSYIYDRPPELPPAPEAASPKTSVHTGGSRPQAA